MPVRLVCANGNPILTIMFKNILRIILAEILSIRRSLTASAHKLDVPVSHFLNHAQNNVGFSVGGLTRFVE